MPNKVKMNIYKFITSNTLKFLIPSFLGIILFMCPILTHGKITIPIAVLSDWMQNTLKGYLPQIVLCLTLVSFVIGTMGWYFAKSKISMWFTKQPFLQPLFCASIFSVLVRGFAFALCLFTYFQLGWEGIYSSATGGLVFNDLLPILFTIFFLAGFLLPLLLNFGLLEFAGTLLIKVMRPLFGLPGRAAIDAIASWLGDGTIGVLLTSKQYEDGYYTEREACVIGTSFSLVSITFCLVVINTVDLSHMFLPFYLTVSFACLIAALVLPKIPPLSRKRNCYVDGTPKSHWEDETKIKGSIKHAYTKALDTVDGKKVIKSVAKDGVGNVLSMWVVVIPIVMAMGTTALIIAEYTPLFAWLGKPFVPFLNLLGIPEAVAVSKTLFAGFADMLLPSVMIANTTNDMARFVVAAVSVTQLIYLSEVGALLIASKIPVRLPELFLIFVERTIITLPIIAVIARLLF